MISQSRQPSTKESVAAKAAPQSQVLNQPRPGLVLQRIEQALAIDPAQISSTDVAVLQRTLGNRTVAQLFAQSKTTPIRHSKDKEEKPFRKKPNNTGLPNNLKGGIEALSGISMDNVKVHYDSSRPAQLNALAYAQGTEIHVAPGQEKHLPHEAWHVAQQAQGRVKPTMQAKGRAINDDLDLEYEADVMGARAAKTIVERSEGTLSPLVLRSEVQQHRTDCCCPTCRSQIKARPNLDNPVQRTVTPNSQQPQGSDNDIETFLTTIDSQAGFNTLNFNADIKIDEMGTKERMEEIAGGEAMSVAAVGDKRYVEGSVPFGTAAKGTRTDDKIERLGQRPDGVHSEQYFEHRGHTPNAVWCAIDNCYFCNGYLGSKNIKHQAMKASNKYPEMWIHPTARWKVVKQIENKHVPQANTRIWTIGGHGGADGVYFNHAHEAASGSTGTSATGTQAAAATVNYDIKTSTGNFAVAGPARTPRGEQEIILENTPSATAIPGLSLKKMTLGSEAQVRSNRRDTIEAVVTVGGAGAANPVVQQLNAPNAVVRLKREVSGANVGMVSIEPRQRVSFHPPYLSDAWIENLRLENGSVSGSGGLRPSLPILNSRPMQLEFGADRLRVFYGMAQRNMPQRSSFVRVTQCTLGVDLLPELRPSGELAFAMGPAGRDLLTGQVTVSANRNGLIFDGTLNAHIPGTDNAQGQVHYGDGRWNGFVMVDSSKIHFPGYQSGELRIDFATNEQGNLSIIPSGRVQLLVANQPVTLEAIYRNNHFLFIGSGRFNLRGLNPLDARVETDGTNVSFEGRTGVTIRDVNGQITVRYRNGRLSGDGTATINKGRAQGTANLHLSERGRVYGDGRLSYRFTDNLTASMGIAMDENQHIRVSGDITLATIRLFERFPQGSSGRRRLFRTHFSVPIAGFTLGPLGDVGLVLAIDPELGVYYGIGPGEIRNARITTAFDPMADDPNLEFTAGAQLNIPFDAGFYITIPASLTLGAVVGSASAGLSATADVGLRGNFDAQAQLVYRQQIWSVEALAGIHANPRLALRIDGFLRAEALGGAYEAEKRWNLRNWEWGSNMNFGIEFPFRYASNQPFQAPSFEDIRFIYPQNLDFPAMIRDVANQAR